MTLLLVGAVLGLLVWGIYVVVNRVTRIPPLAVIALEAPPAALDPMHQVIVDQVAAAARQSRKAAHAQDQAEFDRWRIDYANRFPGGD